MRWSLRFVGRVGLAALLAVLAVCAGLFLYFSDPSPVPATVVDDPALSSIEIGGVRLHAEVAGPAAAPVVIVLHGGPGGDHRALSPLRALASTHRVVFYDQRGAGLSQRLPPEALTLDTHVAELDAIAARFSPDRPVTLIGHSWGAILAAAYLGRHPDRVAAAVLIEPGFLDAAGWQAFQTRAQGLIADSWRTPQGLGRLVAAGVRALHVTGPDPDARADYFMGQMVAGFANHPDNPYHCPGTAFASPSWRLGAQAMSAVPQQADTAQMDAIAGALPRFPGPVLLLTGACDTWIGAPLQRRHLPLFRDATLVDIPDAGHDVIHDQPAAALAAIRTFLASR